MKKLTYLFTILFAVVLMSTSCEKENVTPDTLETQFPDWVNLTWVSTDGVDENMDVDTYPRLDITIVDNLVTVIQKYAEPETSKYEKTYTEMTISGNNVIIGDEWGMGNDKVDGMFTKNGTQITFTTKGLINNEHEFVLQIN